MSAWVPGSHARGSPCYEPCLTPGLLAVTHSCLCSIRRYAARNLEVAVQLATAYAWLTSMMVIALVPIDVWGAYAQSPSTKPIFILWNIAYW